ncbi:nuclear transport factor 2 family protein [Bacillus sp. FJAT-49736]|uniref:nuclear transport factor 2 family protein n=1 Tax=Bacillus sp. FJAT-49736 TaxID=2833582 RepID=UPI001BC8E86F|nr:nuclear transport factor 2 family protein [Bacillus sp. FJAT-49736]MBS4174172.1 hypothetical protein [Bacillus sp. FJAT-49736]
MKWKTTLGILFTSVFLLAACGNNDKADKSTPKTTEKQTETATSNNTVKTDKPSLKEVKNIPADEKKALLAVTNQYIKAFNEKNLDAYMATISKNPSSFKYEEEKAYTKKVFETMNIIMKPLKIAVIGYKTGNANVYLELKTIVTEKGEHAVRTTRQINTYQKEDGNWKLTSIMAMETK